MPNVRRSMIHDGAVGATQLAAGAIGSTALADGSVTATKIGTGAVTSTKLADQAVVPNALANVAATGIGCEFVVSMTIPDSAGDVDVTIPVKAEVIAVTAIKRTSLGQNGDQVTIKNGASAITNAISLNLADNATTGATSIDDATSTISANGTLRATSAKATNCSALVIVRLLRRA